MEHGLKRVPEKQETKNSGKRAWDAACCSTACFVMLFLLWVAWPRGFIPARGKAKFTACVEQLANVKNGLEQYMSDGNDPSLMTSTTAEEACDLILPGYDYKWKCRGKVRERVGRSCDNFKVWFQGDKYELTANSRDEKYYCGICVTERTTNPQNYDKEACRASSRNPSSVCEH